MSQALDALDQHGTTYLTHVDEVTSHYLKWHTTCDSYASLYTCFNIFFSSELSEFLFVHCFGINDLILRIYELANVLVYLCFKVSMLAIFYVFFFSFGIWFAQDPSK